MRKYLLLVAIIFASFPAFSQDFSNKGKDFWVGYGYHIRYISNNNANTQEMVLYFATDVATNVKVEIPALGWVRNYSVPANTVFESGVLPKSGAQDARLPTEGIFNRGIHITADNPIVAYAHVYNGSVSGATLLFPTNTLGKEYYSINFEQRSNEDKSNCFFYAIACDTGTTTIEVTPSANTQTMVAGNTYTFNLTQGQIFNAMGVVNSANNTGVDLTGSKIKSVSGATGGCKKIAVFSGSGKISITCPINNSTSADNYMVQAFPKNAWGKKYLTVPTRNYENNYFRVCVLDPSTIVKLNGLTMSGLVNNFYYQFQTSSPSLIESDKPIMVSQYIPSQNQCGGSGDGDPEVIYLSSVEQNISKVVLNSTPNSGINNHFINIAIPNTGTAISSFRIDGAMPSSSFITHPRDPNYSYLQENVSQGQHTLESDSGFNIIAYGYGQAESYGYNGGTNIKDLYNFITPINPFSIVSNPVACNGTPFYFGVTFPFQPTSLFWDFKGFQTPNVTVTSPVADSTYFIGTKQVWRYKLPSPYVYGLTGVYPVTVTAGTTDPDGCGTTFERDFDLTVYDPPSADFYWLPHSGCITDSVKFRDTTNYAPGTYSYKWFWDFGDGSTDTVRNPVHKFLTTGPHDVKFSLISNVGCFSDTATKQFTVTLVPTAKFGNSTPICQGSAVTFSDSSILNPPDTLMKWFWDYGDGITEVVNNNSNRLHTYSTYGNHNVTLKVETNSGCQSPITTNILYVNPNPVVDFTLPVAVCLPRDSARFLDASTIADGTQSGFSYLWDFGDPASGAENSSTLKDPVHYYNNIGPFNINLSITSAAGCVHDTTKILNTIYPQAIAGFTVSPEFCVNDLSQFNSTSNGNGSVISGWFWDFGDGNTSTLQNPSYAYSVADTFIVRHWVQTDKGCYSDTTSQQIIINPLPIVNFTISMPNCTNKTIVFNDNSTVALGAITEWNWSFGDGNTDNTQNPTHIYASEGVYTVTLVVKTNKGCIDTLMQDITINTQPVAGFIDPEVCLSDSYAQFTDTSSIANGSIVAWEWDFSDPGSGAANTSILQNPQHQYTTVGTKNVVLIVTSNSGCKDTLNQSFFVNGDIPKADFAIQNPAGLCANGSVKIANTSTVNIGSVTKVEIYWDNASAPTVFQTDNFPQPNKIYSFLYPNFQTPATKNYTIRFRAYSGATCIDDKFQSITVNAAPKVQFNIIPNTCLNIPPYQLTQASEIGGVPGSFIFSGPGVSSSGMFSPMAVGPGTYSIKYTFTSNFGCIDTLTQQIKVQQPPVANYNFSSPACQGDPITFTDQSTSTDGILTTWTWDFGDGTPLQVNNSGATFSHIFNSSGTFLVKLTVTTDEGCISAVKQQSVSVTPQPSPNFSFPANSCLPNAIIPFTNLSTIVDGTANTFTFLWSFGDPASGAANTSTAQNPTHTFTGVGPYNVNLRVTSGAGCVKDTTIAINTIHPQPLADFSINKAGICIGETVTFIDLSDGMGGTVNAWSWDFGDGQNSILQNPSYKYNTTDSFNISLYVVNSFGCNSNTITKSFNVYPFPVVDAGPDMIVLEGNSAILQPVVTGNDLQYLWTPATYLNSIQLKNPVTTPLQDIKYKLIVTARGGCTSTDTVLIRVLQNPRIPNTFSPNGDGINERWEIEFLKDYPNNRVQVFTRTGQLVFESRQYLKPWNGTTKDGKSLPIDTYYYIIEPGSGRAAVTGYVTIIK